MKYINCCIESLFIGIGIFCLVIGIISYNVEKARLATYETATAKVTGWIPDPNYKTGDYCPVYKFMTKEGISRTYTGTNCEVKPDPSTVGKQQEQIYYDPTNQFTSVARSGSENTGLIMGICGFMFFGLIGGIWILVVLAINLIKKRNASINQNM